MASLKLLTETQKRQAFERAKAETDVRGGKLVRITKEHYKHALDVLREYVKDEPLQKASGAKWGPDAKQMHMQHLSNNFSIMIVNEQNEEIIGLATNQIQTSSDTHGCEEMEDPGLRNVFEFVDIVEKKAGVLKYFKVSEAIQLASLVVCENYRRQGFGTKLVEATVKMCGHLVSNPVCIKVEGSSFFTKKIAEKQGFIKIFEGFYEDYTINGKKVLGHADIHNSINMYGMLLNAK